MSDNLSIGIKEAKRGNTKLGAELLNAFIANNDHPEAKAWFGYCLAREENAFSKGIAFCKDVLSYDSQLADGYLALARIYLIRKQRKLAVEVLEQGLKTPKNKEIMSLLQQLGIRKRPVIPFLQRGNIINVSMGRLMTTIGLRR